MPNHLQKTQQLPQIEITYAKSIPSGRTAQVSYSVQVARSDGVPMAADEVKRVLSQALEAVQSEIDSENLAAGEGDVDYVPSLMFTDPLIAVKISKLGRAAATAWYDSLSQMRSENELQVVEPASKLGAKRLAEAGYLVALQEKGKFIVPSQHAHYEILPQPKGTVLLMGVPFRKEIFDALRE